MIHFKFVKSKATKFFVPVVSKMHVLAIKFTKILPCLYIFQTVADI